MCNYSLAWQEAFGPFWLLLRHALEASRLEGNPNRAFQRMNNGHSASDREPEGQDRWNTPGIPSQQLREDRAEPEIPGRNQ